MSRQQQQQQQQQQTFETHDPFALQYHLASNDHLSSQSRAAELVIKVGELRVTQLAVAGDNPNYRTEIAPAIAWTLSHHLSPARHVTKLHAISDPQISKDVELCFPLARHKLPPGAALLGEFTASVLTTANEFTRGVLGYVYIPLTDRAVVSPEHSTTLYGLVAALPRTSEHLVKVPSPVTHAQVAFPIVDWVTRECADRQPQEHNSSIYRDNYWFHGDVHFHDMSIAVSPENEVHFDMNLDALSPCYYVKDNGLVHLFQRFTTAYFAPLESQGVFAEARPNRWQPLMSCTSSYNVIGYGLSTTAQARLPAGLAMTMTSQGLGSETRPPIKVLRAWINCALHYNGQRKASEFIEAVEQQLSPSQIKSSEPPSAAFIEAMAVAFDAVRMVVLAMPYEYDTVSRRRMRPDPEDRGAHRPRSKLWQQRVSKSEAKHSAETGGDGSSNEGPDPHLGVMIDRLSIADGEIGLDCEDDTETINIIIRMILDMHERERAFAKEPLLRAWARVLQLFVVANSIMYCGDSFVGLDDDARGELERALREGWLYDEDRGACHVCPLLMPKYHAGRAIDAGATLMELQHALSGDKDGAQRYARVAQVGRAMAAEAPPFTAHLSIYLLEGTNSLAALNVPLGNYYPGNPERCIRRAERLAQQDRVLRGIEGACGQKFTRGGAAPMHPTPRWASIMSEAYGNAAAAEEKELADYAKMRPDKLLQDWQVKAQTRDLADQYHDMLRRMETHQTTRVDTNHPLYKNAEMNRAYSFYWAIIGCVLDPRLFQSVYQGDPRQEVYPCNFALSMSDQIYERTVRTGVVAQRAVIAPQNLRLIPLALHSRDDLLTVLAMRSVDPTPQWRTAFDGACLKYGPEFSLPGFTMTPRWGAEQFMANDEALREDQAISLIDNPPRGYEASAAREKLMQKLRMTDPVKQRSCRCITLLGHEDYLTPNHFRSFASMIGWWVNNSRTAGIVFKGFDYALLSAGGRARQVCFKFYYSVAKE